MVGLIVKNPLLSYTIMMHKQITIWLAALLMLTAAPAVAQEDEELGDAPSVSIEDMLLQQALNGERHIDGRMAQRILDMQAKMQEEKLAAIEAARLEAQNPSVGVSHTAAPDEAIPTVSADEDVTVNANGETITLSAQTLRLLSRLQNRNAYTGAGIHSGAPLAPTGPGTVLAIFVLGLAVGFTYLRAWMLEKKNRD